MKSEVQVKDGFVFGRSRWKSVHRSLPYLYTRKQQLIEKYGSLAVNG